MEQKQTGFRFGLEAEYLIVDKSDYRPLFHPDLTFTELNAALESIPLDGLPPLAGLELETPHKKLMPYVVEGYGVVKEDFKPYDLLPKGIEIRTPLASSVEECMGHLRLLHGRLQTALAERGWLAASLSHHPIQTSFEGPCNKKRYDWWQWAMQVMVTYGPDINVSMPSELTERLDIKDLEAKANYYAPAMTAFSVASPFRAGVPWEIRGEIGKSLRTHRRSVVAPAIETHLHEGGRLEFKTFEMSWRRNDFHCYFLLWLELLLDDGLKGRAEKQTRVYDLGQVARKGWDAETVAERARELMDRAPGVLVKHGFDVKPLEAFARRLDERTTPADELLALYREEENIPSVLRRLTELH